MQGIDSSVVYSLEDQLVSAGGVQRDYSVKERVLPVISGETFGGVGSTLEISKIRISMETGGTIFANESILDPQQNNPVMMIDFSTDGYSFGGLKTIRLGRQGEHTNITFSYRKKFKRLYIRIRISTFGQFSMYNASIDVREAGY